MKNDDYSMSMARANGLSALLLIPLSLVLLVPHAGIWGWEETVRDMIVFSENLGLFVLLVVVGIAIHELLHGLTWIALENLPWSAVSFGVNWKALTPYAHCRVPMGIRAYRWGAAMPGIVLGILPFLVGTVWGSGWWILFGYLFTISASGDLLILWAIRKVPSGVMVRDHPSRAGCLVEEISKENEAR